MHTFNSHTHPLPSRVFYLACGGSLVAPDVVLTAGHCMKETVEEMSVIINGYHDSFVVEPDQHPRMVVEMIRHPNYDTEKFYNDVLLLRLDEPVYDVPFVELNKDRKQPKVGEEVTVMGLGALAEGGDYPELLQEVDLGIIDFDTCNNDYVSVDLGPLIEDTMVCAGTVTNMPQDSCQGDSGGPMINQFGVQVGVISFGLGCAREGFPGVYQRTAVLKGQEDWIGTTLCELTQTNDLDDWCGRPSLSMAMQEESGPTLSMAIQEESGSTLEPTPEERTSEPIMEPTDGPATEPTFVSTAEETSLRTKEPTIIEDETNMPTLVGTSEPSAEDSSVGTQTGTEISTIDVDDTDTGPCIDQPEAKLQSFGGGQKDCTWLYYAHEAIRQWSCVEGNEGWRICRVTCGRCPNIGATS